MKNFKYYTFLIVLFIGTQLRAQDTIPTWNDSGTVNLDAIIANAFAELELSEANTGYLQNKGASFFVDSLYYGDSLDSANAVNYSNFLGMYASVSSWRLNSQSMDSLNGFKQTWANNSSAETLAIAILHVKYNSFKNDIISNNLIEVISDQYHDVESRTESPYLAKHLVAATTKVQEHQGLNCTFYFPNSLKYISNAMFEENTVGTSGFVSGTGVFFRWSIRFDYKSVKVIDTLPYQYQNKLLPNCVHTKIGDDEFWITRDIGIVKYKWLNGHVWELVNHKIK